MTAALASIPSRSDSSLQLGPVELRAHGLAIAIGVVAAVASIPAATLARRRAGSNTATEVGS